MIGILAGMGPMSTGPFVDNLMKKWQLEFNAKDDIDFPHTLIYSLPTPFYINGAINHDLMKKTIINGLLKLQSSGCNFIAMPCNTAHIYFQDLQKSLNIKLLNMIEEVCNKIPKEYKNIAILATETTIENGTYQNHFKNSNKFLIDTIEYQTLVNRLISLVKENSNTTQILDCTKNIIRLLEERKVDVVIVGCTDISLAIKTCIPKGTLLIDSSESLIDAIINEYKKQS